MGPTNTSRNVPYSLSTPQASSGRVPPPSILVRNCIVRSPRGPAPKARAPSYQSQGSRRRDSWNRRGERLTLVDDPGRHGRGALIARRRGDAVHRAAKIEETV